MKYNGHEVMKSSYTWRDQIMTKGRMTTLEERINYYDEESGYYYLSK